MKFYHRLILLLFIIAGPYILSAQSRVLLGIGGEYAVPLGELGKDRKPAAGFNGSLAYMFDNNSSISLGGGYSKFNRKENPNVEAVSITSVLIGYGHPLFNSDNFGYGIGAGYAWTEGDLVGNRFRNNQGVIVSGGVSYGGLLGKALGYSIGPSLNYAKFGTKNYWWASLGITLYTGIIPKKE